MPRIFLSHSSKNKDFVEKIANKFGKDIAVYDKYSFESGMKCFDEILRNLNAVDLFVIFISEAALESDWVKKELNISYDLLKKEKLKQIFPIIIDPNVSHNDPRIPDWMRSGVELYNLHYISNPIIAYRKIKNQLNILNEPYQINRIPYIGNTDLIDAFKNEYYKVTYDFNCIISCGIDGVGRESFIKQCLKIPQTFTSSYYDPIVIHLDFNESIENLIFKIIEVGYSVDDNIDIAIINGLSMDKKIEYLSKQLMQIQDLDEFLIIRDANILIQDSELVWWFYKALEKIRKELTVGIVTNYNVKKHSNSYSGVYVEKIHELNYADKLEFLASYAKFNKICLTKDDLKSFDKVLTGHPLQIIHTIELIKDMGLSEIKEDLGIIADFNNQSVVKLLNRFISLLNYSDEKKEKLLSYISFLANYPNIPTGKIVEINKLDEDYKEFYNKLISFCICRRMGISNDILSISPSMRDYIERNGIEMPENIKVYLENEFTNFENDLKANDLDEYCYSQIEHNLKELVIRDNYKSNYKYIYPSVILKAIVQLYNKKQYDKIIDICSNCLEYTIYWEISICKSFYFYYGLTLAHKKDKKVFQIIKEKKGKNNILDNVQSDFILGFYYKLVAYYDLSLEKFNDCLKVQPNYYRARRELVEVYVNMEEYDLALAYAEDNFIRHADNIFNICQYFKCLVRSNPLNKEKLRDLLAKAADADRFLNSSKQFYPEIKSLYFRLVEKNTKKALSILEENEQFFDNKIYYYKNIFDILEDNRDLTRMKIILNKIEELVAGDSYFLPLLLRRKCVVDYLENQNIAKVKLMTQRANVSETIKTRILKHVQSLNK